VLAYHDQLTCNTVHKGQHQLNNILVSMCRWSIKPAQHVHSQTSLACESFVI